MDLVEEVYRISRTLPKHEMYGFDQSDAARICIYPIKYRGGGILASIARSTFNTCPWPRLPLQSSILNWRSPCGYDTCPRRRSLGWRGMLHLWPASFIRW